MLFINVKHFNKLKNKITIKNSILKISQFWLFPQFWHFSLTALLLLGVNGIFPELLRIGM